MKRLASLLPNRVKMTLLKRRLALSIAGSGTERHMLTILDLPDATSPLRVSMRKDDSETTVTFNLAAAMDQPVVYRMLYARLPPVLRIFSQTAATVPMVVADLSDGGEAPAGGLAFCSSRDDVILIPDPVFLNSGGHARFRRARSMLLWSQRQNTVLWRGTSTGIGEITTQTMEADDSRIRQRVRMCLILRSMPGTDAKIRKTESDASPIDRQRLARHGLLGGKIRQEEWGQYKFALDVDGHTNAWSNFFVRLLLGCCVLKIGSEHGFRQWYYDKLKPWQHYVPVRADMSDLIEKINWCRGHDSECAEIAHCGQAFAHAMTVDSEIGDAVRRLEAAKTGGFTAAAGAS